MTAIPHAAPDLWRRPEVTPLALNIAVATWIMALCNHGFWMAAVTVFKGAPLTLLGMGAAVWAVTFFTLSLVSLPLLHRPLAAALIVTAAAASYYQDALGVLIDREMVRNVMQTTFAESRHLITPDYVQTLLFKGILPAALIFGRA